ncbi:MAG: formate-dependent phosphoribosylglycinamide formyltransferase (GAR transformylase), partial [Planctomycetota bacterium]
MIGGGLQQIDAARILSAAGLRVIVSDRNERAPAFRHADESWVVDGHDTAELTKRAIDARDRGLAGVFTLTEMVESVASVAYAASLP